MKIKIKAAVVLNGRETHVIAGVLQRVISPVKAMAQPSDADKEEEKRVIQDFLAKREELSRALN